MPFTFEPTEIPDVILVLPRVFKDPRGYFLESYRQSHFLEGRIPGAFVQDNQSRSVCGTLRGLHFQQGEYAQSAGHDSLLRLCQRVPPTRRSGWSAGQHSLDGKAPDAIRYDL
jgi:hypothetical protein